MPPRRIWWVFPMLAGCNALLDIDSHPLRATAGGPGADNDGGNISTAGTSTSGSSTSAQGGSATGNQGGTGAASGAEAGTPGDDSGGGSGAFGGKFGAGGNGGAHATEGGSTNSGGNPNTTGSASNTTGGGKSTGGSGNSSGANGSSGGSANGRGGASSTSGGSTISGGLASGTGGTVTTNACQLGCPATQVCVDGACVDCRNGERRCSSDGTPLSCVKQAWTAQPACGGSLPLCSNGSCVGIRLIGGLVSVQGALSSSKARLVQGSLELTKPTCSTALGKCVVGGLRP